MQNQGGETEGEHCQGQPKEQAPITLDHYAKDCEMARDRAAHHTQRQQRSSPGKARTQKQTGRNQLDHARDKAAPRFHPDLRKDIDRFRRSGEFEEQRLKQDSRRRQTANPAHHTLRFV